MRMFRMSWEGGELAFELGPDPSDFDARDKGGPEPDPTFDATDFEDKEPE